MPRLIASFIQLLRVHAFPEHRRKAASSFDEELHKKKGGRLIDETDIEYAEPLDQNYIASMVLAPLNPVYFLTVT